MEIKVSSPPSLKGEIAVPGDKSISHRAAIFNSIAQGQASIGNFSPGADCLSTVNCLRALGVSIEAGKEPSSLVVRGVGLRGLLEAADVLDAGNSGTTMRLLAGLLAGQSFFSVITGDASLRSRPMGRIIEPLRLMGAQVWGRGGDALAPLAIRGTRLRGIEYRLSVASAQVKSALLLAGLLAEGNTIVEEPAPSRDHTERLLRSMGAHLEIEGTRIALSPTAASLRALDIEVPGDISSAAFWLVAGAIHPHARLRIAGVGINPTRSGILDVLKEMGARLAAEHERVQGGEPVADLVVESSSLTGVSIGGDLVPRLIDEIPAIAVAAAVARGTTTIRDAAELRVKESDRIVTIARELSRLGARVEELPDGMVIHGGRRLTGASCQSYGDHRLAMALAVAGLVAGGEVVVHGAEAADVSYPGFWQELQRLGESAC